MSDGEGEFNPNWSSPPGDTIRDLMEENDLSIWDLARNIGLDSISLHHLLDGIMPITYPLAIRLERTLGPPAEFWMEREEHYRESQFGPRKRE